MFLHVSPAVFVKTSHLFSTNQSESRKPGAETFPIPGPDRGPEAWRHGMWVQHGPAISLLRYATLCYAGGNSSLMNFGLTRTYVCCFLALAGHVEDATKRRTFLRFDSTLEYSLKHCQAFRAKSQATTYIHISHIACSSMLFISFLWRPTDYKIFLDRRHAVK